MLIIHLVLMVFHKHFQEIKCQVQEKIGTVIHKPKLNGVFTISYKGMEAPVLH